MTEDFAIFPALVTKQDLEKSKEYLLKPKLIIPTALPICVIELPIQCCKDIQFFTNNIHNILWKWIYPFIILLKDIKKKAFYCVEEFVEDIKKLMKC